MQKQGQIETVANKHHEYIYDVLTGEWRLASEMTVAADAGELIVRDASGNVLADGDSVTLIKDLRVKAPTRR